MDLVEKEVVKTIKDQFQLDKKDQVDLGTDLRKSPVNADTLDIAEILLLAEDNLEILSSDSLPEIEKLSTVEDVVDFIKQKLGDS